MCDVSDLDRASAAQIRPAGFARGTDAGHADTARQLDPHDREQGRMCGDFRRYRGAI